VALHLVHVDGTVAVRVLAYALRGRTEADNVARLQREPAARIGDDFLYGEAEVGRVVYGEGFTVERAGDFERVRVVDLVGGSDPRADWAESVRTLRAGVVDEVDIVVGGSVPIAPREVVRTGQVGCAGRCQRIHAELDAMRGDVINDGVAEDVVERLIDGNVPSALANDSCKFQLGYGFAVAL